MLNRFNKYVNRFRKLKYKSEGYEDDVKIEMHQTKNELIQETRDED